MLSLEFLRDLATKNSEALGAPVREFELKGRLVSSKAHKSIMGVINLSPDSWYRESVCLSAETAIRRAFVLQEQGADIVDIGADRWTVRVESETPIEAGDTVALSIQPRKLHVFDASGKALIQ